MVEGGRKKMVDKTYEILKRIWGEEAARKYLEAKRKSEELPKKKLDEIKAFADEHMPKSENFHVQYEIYDVLLVESPSKESLRQIRETSAGNYKVTVIWHGSDSLRGPFLTVFTPTREMAEKLVAKAGVPFYIVGKLKEQMYQGDKSYTFRCSGVIDLSEGIGVELAEDEEEEIKQFVEAEEEFEDADVEVNL